MNIDTNFSLISFIIYNDTPYILNTLPADPILVAFSDYEDVYSKGPLYFDYKQLNWIMAKYKS